MTTFRYRAYGANGRVLNDRVSAPTEADAVRVLMREGLTPFEIAEATGAASPARTGQRLPARALAGFCRSLATMKAGGLPLDEALDLIASDPSDRHVAKFAAGVREAVLSGRGLADALSEQKQAPPDYVIGLVRAGEAGGSLAPVLQRIADSVDNQIRLANSLRGALVYPAILFATAMASVILILLVVAPALKPVLMASGENTPGSARALIGASDFLQQWWSMGLMGGLVLFLLVSLWARGSSGKRMMSGLALKLPVMGPVLRDIETARFLSSFSALIENGMPAVPALSIARDGSGNPFVREAVGDIAEEVRQGKSFSAALIDDGFFPVAAGHMATVGEKSGALPAMLAKAAGIFEDRSARQINRITTVAGPALTLILGLVIGGVVLTLLGAIMSVNDLAV